MQYANITSTIHKVKSTIWVFRRSQAKKLRQVVRTPKFGRFYVLGSFALLVVSSLFWALLGANLQSGNADQLVDNYLFEHVATLHGALLPAQHSFLLKWPLFYLVGLFGSSYAALMVCTVGVVLVTVIGLALILRRIERRPLMLGTLFLALTSVLLMVPTQPYPGGLLPVNMAMITTRNLEYLLYIGSLALLVKASRMRHWLYVVAILSMSLLIASDGLFMSLSIGGALLALVFYALAKRWNFVSLSVDWLVASVIASGLSIVWIGLIELSGLVTIAGQGANPYGIVHQSSGVVLGVIYGALGLLTNFGANPAYDTTLLARIPHQAITRLLSLSGAALVINIAIFIVVAAMSIRLFGAVLAKKKSNTIRHDNPFKLSILLLWSFLAALGAFVVSNHYYPVDARYLTIALFAGFISTATFVRGKRWRPEHVVAIGIVLVVGISLGFTAAISTYNSERLALSDINTRNTIIAEVVAQHPVSTVVGDYWRVLPIRLASGGSQKVMPLSDCLQPRKALSSTQWQPKLRFSSFAYVLSLDRSLTDFPNCSLAQVVAHFGKPNANTVIDGTLTRPKELLLFYDHGIARSSPLTNPLPTAPATVVPIALAELPYTSCTSSTIMNVVAHEDDDLLFLNPDLQHDISAGHCVRTIYVTAGDDGLGKFYWLAREQGSEAAYSYMRGSEKVWVERIVKLPGGQFVTIANPRGNPKISIIFMHLPDGNIHGQGFRNSNNESLQSLIDGKVRLLQAVDGQSSYTSQQLVAALSILMNTYAPAEIRTQSTDRGSKFPDHSDHRAVGHFTILAHQDYVAHQYQGRVDIPLSFYTGYPIRELPANVTGQDLTEKEAAFLTYAAYDPSVCQSLPICLKTPTYNAYLARQYQSTQ